MLLVLSEDHRDHVALLAKVDPPGKLATRRVTASPSAVLFHNTTCYLSWYSQAAAVRCLDQV